MAILRLTTWANEEHYELPCNSQRRLMSVILLQKREREIDSRGDPRRGVDRSVPKEYRIGQYVDLGKLPSQPIAEPPMGHCPLTIEKAGSSEHESPGADRGDAARPASGLR